MKVTFPRTKYRSKKVDDYLEKRDGDKKQTQQKDTGGRWKDPTWLVLFGKVHLLSCPLSKPSSHPPLVRGNVSYFRLVKGESTNHWASSLQTASPGLAPMHLLNPCIHW
jgi:hypothetical protein